MGKIKIRRRLDIIEVHRKGITDKSGRCGQHPPDLLIEKHHLILFPLIIYMCSENHFVSKARKFFGIKKIKFGPGCRLSIMLFFKTIFFINFFQDICSTVVFGFLF